MTATAYDRVTARLTEITGFTGPPPVIDRPADWRCPAHPDKSPSLSVTPLVGKVLVHCQAGCDRYAVLSTLGMTDADLFDGPANGNGHRRREEPIATYPYVDEAGKLLYEVVRFPAKQFRQRRPDGNGGWEWSLKGTRRVLYRLPSVIEAVRGGKWIYVVEGEKDVQAVEAAGGVATCNSGGAGKWAPEHSTVLHGAYVVIVADNDEPGAKHAEQVRASLDGVAMRVRVVTAAIGKDAADHLAAGHTLDEWLAPPKPARPLERSMLGQMVRAGVPEPTMVHDWLYAGGLHSLQAEPEAGKSWLALVLSLELLEGYSVIYLDEEGGEELVAERLEALGADPDLIDQRFFYFPFPSRSWTAEDVEALEAVITEAAAAAPNGLGLVVLDSLPDFLEAAGKDEDRSRDVTGFVKTLLAPLRAPGAALLVLDHLVKPDAKGEGKRSRYARGSGAKLAKAHLTLLLETVTPFDKSTSGQLRLYRTKDRRGAVTLPRLGTAGLLIDVRVDRGTVSFVPRVETATTSSTGWNGPTDCMDAVEELLGEAAPEDRSKTAIVRELCELGKSYRPQIVQEALDRLVGRGRVTRKGSRYTRSGEAQIEEEM